MLEKCKGREAYIDDQDKWPFMKASCVQGVLKKLIGSLLRLRGFVPRSLELCPGIYGYNPDEKDITVADFMMVFDHGSGCTSTCRSC